MIANPGSEDHQWEGCKGLADLAARDSDGQSAVRRQGGIQVWLKSCRQLPAPVVDSIVVISENLIVGEGGCYMRAIYSCFSICFVFSRSGSGSRRMLTSQAKE